MKMLQLATLSLAVLLYATAALAQHGRSSGAMGGAMGGGMAGGMGNSTGHASGNVSNHGNANTASGGSNHQASVNDVLAKNPAIGDKIQSLTGQSATEACQGFKNLGGCVAAAHVSKNLGITFDCLRSDLTGQAPLSTSNCPAGTGSKSMSLGKAIQTLDPAADQKAESKKAQGQAAADLKGSNS
jgi:hypothetical protein